LNLKDKVISAPMANIAGSAYRVMALRCGAALAYSEMISADGLVRGNKKTLAMLRLRAGEKPVCFQIFGHDPDVIHDAARIVEQSGCDMIDINLGCPAKKIVRNSGGAALLRDLKTVDRIVSSVVKAVDIPVSIKFRSGWDYENPIFIELGKIAESCGASYLVLHPRTKSSGFKGKSDWEKIKALKDAVGIKVIGNGDITNPAEARRMLDETGCDYVMVGRAAMGAPWIFRRIDTYLKTGIDMGQPADEEKIRIILEFVRLMIDDFGEYSACLKLRKHLAWFTKGWQSASKIRPRIFSVKTYHDIESILITYAKDPERIV